jgi:hypothetical protein
MLYISINKSLPNEVSIADFYFDAYVDEVWFESDFVKQMILDIDKTECYSMYNMKSPMLGAINCTKLSTGVKNLIIAYNVDNVVINATHCGDNCAKWLLKIAELKDLTIELFHPMRSPRESFCAILLNNGKTLETLEDYHSALFDYLIEED